MNYKQHIEKEIGDAILKGVDFGATGRNGADNSYRALERVREKISALAKEQLVDLEELKSN